VNSHFEKKKKYGTKEKRMRKENRRREGKRKKKIKPFSEGGGLQKEEKILYSIQRRRLSAL